MRKDKQSRLCSVDGWVGSRREYIMNYTYATVSVSSVNKYSVSDHWCFWLIINVFRLPLHRRAAPTVDTPREWNLVEDVHWHWSIILYQYHRYFSTGATEAAENSWWLIVDALLYTYTRRSQKGDNLLRRIQSKCRVSYYYIKTWIYNICHKSTQFADSLASSNLAV